MLLLPTTTPLAHTYACTSMYASQCLQMICQNNKRRLRQVDSIELKLKQTNQTSNRATSTLPQQTYKQAHTHFVAALALPQHTHTNKSQVTAFWRRPVQRLMQLTDGSELIVFAAFLCIAAAYPSIVGPAIIPALGPRVIVGPVAHPLLVPGLPHAPILAPGHVIVG
ncbi:unnamed protein product [Ceratitis capitata]|uniref:(Mediterranean fruit fly) hypothetical protein n=1 Tax=Ceratitis capitata TaxID=7213 RepID=A0A811V7V1_CERCA|nr:unnamed protein product [Ceratitis capitata]